MIGRHMMNAQHVLCLVSLMKNLKVTLDHYVPTWVAEKAISKPYATAPTEGRLERVVRVNKHKSVAEFLGYWFDIQGISRLCLQELARHRIASFCIESTRFTIHKAVKEYKETGNIRKFYVSPFEEDKDLSELDDKVFSAVHAFLNEADYLLQHGYKNDQIKYLLPECWAVNGYVYMNARSFENFIGLRFSKYAHFEIRNLAREMIKLIPDDQRFIIADIIANRGELL